MAVGDYRSALVTGASAGVGKAVAVALARRGLEVFALARRRDRLEELARAEGCRALALDVRDTRALEGALRGLAPDILVHCAGMNRGYGGVHEALAANIDEVLDVNLRAALHLVRLVAPGMVARGLGHLVLIGSINGAHEIDGMSVYGTAKAGLHMMSRLLRLDLFASPVRVTEIVPGRVKSEFHAKAVGDAEAAAKTFYEGRRTLTPEDVASAVLFALDAPRHVNVSVIEIAPIGQVAGGSRYAKSE